MDTKKIKIIFQLLLLDFLNDVCEGTGDMKAMFEKGNVDECMISNGGCLHGATCLHHPDGAVRCMCAPGWVGETCQVIDKCAPTHHSHCHHDATCVYEDSLFKCICTENWSGTHCKVPKIKKCLEKYDNSVTKILNDQIDVHLAAQYLYINLAHAFQQSDLYYQQTADFFTTKSSDHLRTANELMTYQAQRGTAYSKSTNVQITVPSCEAITSLYDGFKCAQDLETTITSKLTELVAIVSDVKPTNELLSSSQFQNNEDLRWSQAVLVKHISTSEAKPLMAAIQENTWHTNNCQDIHSVNYTETS